MKSYLRYSYFFLPDFRFRRRVDSRGSIFWIFMDYRGFSGFSWISEDFHGFQRIFMDFRWFSDGFWSKNHQKIINKSSQTAVKSVLRASRPVYMGCTTLVTYPGVETPIKKFICGVFWCNFHGFWWIL